jgi:hypothetical protein
MTLDLQNREIYFGSEIHGKSEILKAPIGQNASKSVFTEISELYFMIRFNNTIFWQDNNDDIFSMSKENSRKLSVNLPLYFNIVSPILQPILPNSCQNKKCSNLCLRSEKQPYYKCACKTGTWYICCSTTFTAKRVYSNRVFRPKREKID